jgi:hypothetical protein
VVSVMLGLYAGWGGGGGVCDLEVRRRFGLTIELGGQRVLGFLDRLGGGWLDGRLWDRGLLDPVELAGTSAFAGRG